MRRQTLAAVSLFVFTSACSNSASPGGDANGANDSGAGGSVKGGGGAPTKGDAGGMSGASAAGDAANGGSTVRGGAGRGGSGGAVDASVEHAVAPAHDAAVLDSSLMPRCTRLEQVGAVSIGHPTDAALQGGYLYVVSVDAGFQIYDVRDPLHPMNTASFPLDLSGAQGAFAPAVTVDGGIAFVQNGSSLIKVDAYDLTDPAHPVFKSSLSKDLTVSFDVGASRFGLLRYSIDLTGSNHDGVLTVYDTSDIANPTQLVEHTYTGQVPVSAAFQGDYVYVNTTTAFNVTNRKHDGTLHVYHLASGSLTEVGSFAQDAGDNYGNKARLGGLTVRENYAYVSEDEGILVMDVSEPAKPKVVRTVTDRGVSQRLLLQGDMGVISSPGGISVFDMRAPAAPVELTSTSFAELNSQNVLPLGPSFDGRLVSTPELNGGQVLLYKLGACGDE